MNNLGKRLPKRISKTKLNVLTSIFVAMSMDILSKTKTATKQTRALVSLERTELPLLSLKPKVLLTEKSATKLWVTKDENPCCLHMKKCVEHER